MSFTVEDFHDLVRMLEQHPEWRAELRRLLLTDEILSLPQLVQELSRRMVDLTQRVDSLAEAQKHAEERLTRLEETVAKLAEAQKHAEERLTRLEDKLVGVEDRLTGVEERLSGVEDRVARVEDRLTKVEDTTARLVVDVGDLKGMGLEQRYRERAFAYFSPLVRQARVVPGEKLMEWLEDSEEKGIVSREDIEEITRADLVVQGLSREDDRQVHLVVEISWGIGLSDVERAQERAELLSRLGISTLPVVAGKTVTPEAEAKAKSTGVWQVIDGKVSSPS